MADVDDDNLNASHPDYGHILARIVFVLGVAFASLTLFLSYEVDQTRLVLAQQTGWRQRLDRLPDPTEVYIDIVRAAANGDVSDELTSAAAEAAATGGQGASATDQKDRVIRSIHHANQAISTKLNRYWYIAKSLLALSAAIVVAASAGVIWGQNLRSRLGMTTQRHQRATDEARKQARLLNALFDQSPFGVHVFDRNGRALYSNPNNTRRRGLVAPDFVAEGVSDIRTHPMTLSVGAVDAINRALQGETVELTPKQMTFPVANGRAGPPQTLWLSPVFFPVHNDFGEVDRLVALIRDETEKKTLSDRVQRAEQLAEVGTLAAGVAHEINNPLTFLAMNFGLIDEMISEPEPSIEDIRTLLSDVHHGIERIRNVTADLSALALPMSERAGPLHIDHLLERVVHMVEVAEQSDCTILLSIQLSELHTIHGTVSRLEQVFTNLLQNALWACNTRDDGEVRVKAGQTANEKVWVEVHDNGVGISPEQVTQIFEPFFTTRRGGRGTGLGLYLVRCYLEELGGTIEAHSVLGEGTCMRVTLPIRSSASFSPPVLTSTIKLLIVTDNPELTVRVSQLLPELEGIDTVRSVEEMVGKGEDKTPWDIIFTESPQTADEARTRAPSAAVTCIQVPDSDPLAVDRQFLIQSIHVALTTSQPQLQSRGLDRAGSSERESSQIIPVA